jgi:hypothetical protein
LALLKSECLRKTRVRPREVVEGEVVAQQGLLKAKGVKERKDEKVSVALVIWRALEGLAKEGEVVVCLWQGVEA